MNRIWDTAKASDIIHRAHEMHPSLLREALEKRHAEDCSFAVTREAEGFNTSSIRASAYAAHLAMRICEEGDFDVFDMQCTIGAGIIALNIACRLQCIPPHVRTAVAIRTWPQEK